MSLKIHLLSDLHLEHKDWTPPKNNADIVILAGDIHSGTKGIDWAVKHFPDQAVIYITGNHEFYGLHHEALIDEFRKSSEKNQIHFLENNEIVIDGYRFLGTTLWTDYKCFNPGNQTMAMMQAQMSLADHRFIRTGKNNRTFSPYDALALHEYSRQWLTEKLNETNQDYKKTVVISHHGPSLDCAHHFFGHNSIGACFYSDLDELVKLSDYWFYGHVHSNINKIIRGTRVISNQKGYPHEKVPGFNENLIINI